MRKWQRAMLVVAPTAFFVLRIVRTQLEEVAVDRRDPPHEYAADLLDRPEVFSAGVPNRARGAGLAEHYQDAAGARLLGSLEFPVVPLGLTLLGAFALGNGLASLHTAVLPRWVAGAGLALGVLLVVSSAVQPLAEPTVSRSEEAPENVVSVVTGLLLFGLVPLWAVAAGVGLLRRTR